MRNEGTIVVKSIPTVILVTAGAELSSCSPATSLMLRNNSKSTMIVEVCKRERLEIRPGERSKIILHQLGCEAGVTVSHKGRNFWYSGQQLDRMLEQVNWPHGRAEHTGTRYFRRSFGGGLSLRVTWDSTGKITLLHPKTEQPLAPQPEPFPILPIKR